jgi:8-oxo-dGTP diphosphatase
MKPQQENDIRFAVLATDIACFRIIDKQLCILIGKAAAYSPFAGQWALIGGMIRPKETAEDAASRLLLDKAGIKKIYTEQVHTFSAINRDPRGRVVSVAYLALAYFDPQDISKAKLETKWLPLKKLPKLAYDHDEIVKHSLNHLKLTITNTDLARHLLPHEFTLTELQNVHEVVMGERMDKRNFRKKILSSGMLKDTKRTQKKGVMRPAVLFIFK